MKLQPKTQNIRDIRFTVYDMEWWTDKEPYELRVIGVYDEDDFYRYYTTVEEFLDTEIKKSSKTRTFFAHFGGRADVQFLVEYFTKKREGRYQVELVFNGSSAFMVFVHDRVSKKSFKFYDSYFIFQAKLDKIGQFFNMQKGSVDFNTKDLAALVKYNAQDCRILYEAIKNLAKEVKRLGGDFKPTLASMSMALFKCRFLKTEIRTQNMLNRVTRQSYYASRVEVFEKKCDGGKYFDINSSFPWSMTQPLPANLHSVTDKPVKGKLYIAECEFEIKDCYLPPVPYRLKGRIFFPTGKISGWYTGVDIELAKSLGHKVKILKCLNFDIFYDLKDYVSTLYELKANSDGFKRNLYKLFLNSLYGKFGERPDKTKLLYNPDNIFEDMEKLGNGFFVQKVFKQSPHMHVPISSYVTAYSRKKLFDYLSQCKKIYYTDTDSIVCGFEDNFETTEELGDLKLEYIIKGNAVFEAPKLYAFDYQKDDGTVGSLVKSKGFSRLDRERFDHLLDGGTIHTFNLLMGIKESIRSKGHIDAVSKKGTKQLRNVFPKRYTYADGSTRPWTVNELEDKLLEGEMQ